MATRKDSGRERALALLASPVDPGPPFFEVVAQALALATGCRWAGVGHRVDGDAIELLAFWDDGRQTEPFRLPPTAPCAEVYRGSADAPHAFYGQAVAERFPAFDMLDALGVRSYRGEAFFDADGALIGHICAFGDRDEGDDEALRDFFRLVAQRVGAEYHRWRAERALGRSEARYAALFRQSHDGVLMLDQRGRILDVNQATCHRLGRTREAMIGQSVFDMLARRPSEALTAGFRGLVAGEEKSGIFPVVVRRSDGQTYPVEFNASLVAADGEHFVQVIVRDLTERQRTAAALRVYQHMVASVGDQMVFVDRNYVFQAINAPYLESPRIRQRFGDDVQIADIVGLRVGQVIGEERFERLVRRHLDQALEGHEVSFETEVEGADPPYFLHVRYHPHRVDGRVVGVVGILRNISRRKRDQAAILRIATAEAVKLGDVASACRVITETAAPALDVARVSIWRFFDDQQRLVAIDRFTRATGAHDDGATIDAAELPRFVAALASGQVVDADDARTDERTRELTATRPEIGALLVAPVRVGGAVVGVVRFDAMGEPRYWRAADLSLGSEMAEQVASVLMNRERRRLEEQLFRTRKLESLGKLAGGVAHDFNNLLTRILGGSELALHEPEVTQAIEGHLRKVRAAAKRASELCNQMLAYAGERQLSRDYLAIDAVVANVVSSLRTRESDVAITVEAEGEPPTVEGDEGQLRQLVSGLITNAIEATRQRGPVDGRSAVRVGIATVAGSDPIFDRALEGPADPAARAQRYARIMVHDEGTGMDDETLANVFDPFFTTKFAGRGLGMAAVLGAVQAHEGAIVIDTKPEAGTRVDVLLPAATRSATRQPAAAVAAPATGPKHTVMLVDDEPSVRDIARKMLEVVGYDVVSASGGAEALEAFDADPEAIDAVLLDLTMPGMSGDEVARALREIRPQVPIVLSSGYSEGDASAQLGDLRFDGYLRKPYELQMLIDTMKAAVAGGRAD